MTQKPKITIPTKYKLGDVIEGRCNKKFIVKKDPGKLFYCQYCVFSVEGNPSFDIHANCKDRRASWIKDYIFGYRCSDLIPKGCIFAEVKGGI